MEKSFVKGAMWLTICGLIGKIIGALYRIPFSYIVGAEGLGLYQLVYPLFTLMITISTSGLPRGISKLLSEQWASGNHALARKTFKISMTFLLIFSFLGSLLIGLLAYPISKLQGNTDAFGCYVAISPAVLFVGIISGYRGYFQAKENMIPTAISGLIEQITKLLFGLGLAYIFRASVIKATIGALCGVTISEVVALVYLFINYKFHTRKVPVIITSEELRLTNKQIVKKILSISIPIALGGLVMPISLIIDSSLIVKILSKTFSSTEATTLFGLQSGVVGSLCNLPVVASSAVATAILPQISKENTYKNNDKIVLDIKNAVKFASLVSLPIAICFYIFSQQIILFLYKNSFSIYQVEVCSNLLKVGSTNIIFLALSQVSASILQGLGKVKIPLYSLLFGSIIKVIFVLILVNNPEINIYGAEISDTICYFVIFVINFAAIHKFVHYNNVVASLKVVLFSLIIGGVGYLSKLVTFSRLSSTLCLFLAGGLTAIVYFCILFLELNAEKIKEKRFAYKKVNKKRKN